MNEIYKYRVGWENDCEHIDFWDYTKEEKGLAEARYDNVEVGAGEGKYLLDLETGMTLKELYYDERI